ncbi:MAG: hypothetical protein PHP30_02970 [Bacteroidales bacterium]|nr:hypothetical protein [Bacteroidales bacterium]MDD2425189.1 hypothetical protein [Bacteroidales bacterium]MDD3989043.1 hypothetical protein [Bacteroidales bacterium]MDD4639252.1 hypothetical protein [Bacteroidales bacterium]
MKKEYILEALIDNQISVLNRITSAYMKRQISIESLKLSKSYVKGVKKVVISSHTTEEVIGHIVRQLNNLEDLHKVDYYLPKRNNHKNTTDKTGY